MAILKNFKIIIAVICFTLNIMTMLFLTGCLGDKYNVDYCGQKFHYTGAKDSYRAGRKVTLYYSLIATDTDYAFYLDGEPVNPKFDDQKGFIICFIMPEHDVTLECISKNSMPYVPKVKKGVMLVDYYTAVKAAVGADGYYELVLTTTADISKVQIDEYKENAAGEKICTSYTVPYSAAEKCMAIIESYDLSDWNNIRNPASVDGAVTVCKFFDGDTYVRVSTDSMPEDGIKVLDMIKEVLAGYLKDQYLIS